MDPYKHRRSRPLHQYRLGWTHYQQHRTGVRHGHRRSSRNSKLDLQRTPADTIRHARHLLRSGPLVEFARRRRPDRGAAPPPAPDVPPRPPRSRRAELARQVALGTLLALVVAFLLVSVWAFITIWQARTDLRGAQSEATALARDRTQLFSSKGRARAARQIAAMHRGATAAAALVDGSIPLHALSWIPFVGQQVTGVTSLVNDFDTTSQQAATLLSSLQGLVRHSHGTSISLPALEALDQHVHASVLALRPLDRGSGVLVGPIATARDNFDKETTKVTALLATGGNLLNYALPFLGADGPRTYFVAGENDAEMRDQGAVLSWAILTAKHGTFSMTKSHSVGTLRIRHPAPVRLPLATLAAFGQLEPEQVWQSVDATADFPLSAQVMAAMYRQRTHHSVDGVIGVDPFTIEHILQAIGQVDISGIPRPVTSHNVLFVLMHGLYLLYPKGYQQGRRHDEVAAVASAAVAKMKSKHHHYDLAYLVDQLAKAAHNRHLLVWSRFPKLEQAVENFGASGSLVAQGTNAVHLAIESAVAAKLDWYVHTAVIYNVTIDPIGDALITATIVVANEAPKGCRPHYICGPDHINSSIKGQYVGRLDLWLPRGAVTDAHAVGDESGLVLARDTVRLKPKQIETIVIQATVPNAVHDGTYTLRFIPQSTYNPQLFKVEFAAPGWSTSGPTSTTWWGTSTTSVTWKLSH
jgi:hypothetical protein